MLEITNNSEVTPKHDGHAPLSMPLEPIKQILPEALSEFKQHGNRGVVLKDGSIEFKSEARSDLNRSSANVKALDHFGSFQLHKHGPLPEQNFDLTYINKDHYLLKETKDKAGHTFVSGSDGYKKVVDKAGNFVAANSPTEDPVRDVYNKKTGVDRQENSDGTVLVVFDKDGHSESTEPDRTKTTKWMDGTVKVEGVDAQGKKIGSLHKTDHAGNYRERGWGTRPQDNYDETYDNKTGITRRVEGRGAAAAEQKITTTTPDGSIKVLAGDGRNYQRYIDGREHYWGREKFDKPAYDYAHDKDLNQARQSLDKNLAEHLPSDKQAVFKADLADFEKRAHKEHLAPVEMSKTYLQFSRLLTASDDKSVLAAANRTLLAQSLIHLCAHPGEAYQGSYETCNVTAALKIPLSKNPSTVAELAVSTAIGGAWKAPDGFTAKLDQESLLPQGEATTYPPAKSGQRTYATQILNVAMVNDCLQRRPDPQYYLQKAPDPANPDDSGERRLDSKHELVVAKQFNHKIGDWIENPDSTPGLSNYEVEKMAQRLNPDAHVLSTLDAQSAVTSVSNLADFEHQLRQLKNQNKFPVILGVDGHHAPIQEEANEEPAYAGHFVVLDALDEKHKRVHVSNQWGKDSDKWVDIKPLYNNSAGTIANKRDGVNRSDFQ